MLFQSMVPAVFKEMTTKTYGMANIERKKEASKRLDFYHDDHLDYLEETLNQLFSDPSVMLKAHLNIIRKIVTQLAMVYKTPPARTIEGSEQDQERFNEMIKQASLDVKLRQASRYVKLLKTILLRPVWRKGQMDLDILTPDILDVACGLSPEDIQEVLITDYGTSQQIEEVEFSYWSAESWRRLDHAGNVIEEQPNPYKILPFVPRFDYPPPGSEFWLTGGDDLVSLQEAINVKLVDLLHLLQMQSFGVGWIKGAQGGGTLKVDPGSLVELPGEKEAAIGFESQKAEIGQVVNAIDKLIKWAVVSQGLSAASMSTDLSDRQSGEAKRIDKQELDEARLEDVALWRKYERQLFNIMRVVWNYHNSRSKISEQARLKIDFSDPKTPASPKEEAEADDLALAQGVITPVDLVMRNNPDLKTREEALEYLMKLKEETRTLES